MNMKLFFVLIVSFTSFFYVPQYAGAQVGGAYKVRVVALRMPFEKSRFDNIKDLGVLLFESAENGYIRVYLGNYLGKSTAEIIVQEVKNRGYSSPYSEKLPSVYQEPYHRELTHTLQFSAVSKLNMSTIYENPEMSEALKDGLYISYYDGLFHLSLGIVEVDDGPRITEYKEAVYRMGFYKSILKPIYQNTRSTTYNRPKTYKKRPNKSGQNSDLKLRPVKTPQQ